MGAPIDTYATPRVSRSPDSTCWPGANAEVVSRLSSPENGGLVKKDAAMLAALAKAPPKSDGVAGGIDCSDAASVIDTTSPDSFRMLRLMWRSRQAASECG